MPPVDSCLRQERVDPTSTSFLTSGATTRSTHQRLGCTSLESTRWSLRSSSDRTRSFRFPHDQPGHFAHGPPACCQRVSSKGSLTTRKGREVMLEQTLPIGANSIYEASAGRISLTVFAAAASSRETSVFVFTHPSCLKYRLQRKKATFGPFTTQQRVCDLTPRAVDSVNVFPKSIQTAYPRQAHIHPAVRLAITACGHSCAPGRHRLQMCSTGGKTTRPVNVIHR